MEPWQQQGMSRFVGRNVIVTGAASGIGLATLRRFLGEGAHALAVDRNGSALEAALAPLRSARVLCVRGPVAGSIAQQTRLAETTPGSRVT